MTAHQKIPILFVHSSDELYGSDVVLLELIRRLDRNLFEPIVVVPTDIAYEGKLSKILSQLGVTCYPIKMGVLRRRYLHPLKIHQLILATYAGNRRIAQIVRQHNIRLVHSNTSAVLNGAFAAHSHHLTHVWHVHEILEKPAWLGKFIYRFIGATSDHIVAISHAVSDHMTMRLPASSREKVQVIWNGVDCDRFFPAPVNRELRRQWGAADDEVLLAVVGRISHWKGQTLALQAMAHSLGIAPHLKVKMALVGSPVPGEEFRLDELAQLARQLKIENKIIFIPFHNDVPKVMQAIDILLLPSMLPEPMGLVVLEAMASGKPVIASGHGGPLETVVDQITGLHFSPNDEKSLSEMIVALGANAERRDQMGHSGRQRALEHFSLKRFADTFNSLYSKAALNQK